MIQTRLSTKKTLKDYKGRKGGRFPFLYPKGRKNNRGTNQCTLHAAGDGTVDKNQYRPKSFFST
jgi:hypothetical protein